MLNAIMEAERRQSPAYRDALFIKFDEMMPSILHL
jgi:hypothetical protein